MEATTGNAFEQLLDAARACDVRGLDDVHLRERLVNLEAARNTFEALQAQVMVEMRDRAHRDDVADPSIVDGGLVPVPMREEFVVDEVAVEPTCTRVAAGHRVATAQAAHQHPAVGAAWAAGFKPAERPAG